MKTEITSPENWVNVIVRELGDALAGKGYDVQLVLTLIVKQIQQDALASESKIAEAEKRGYNQGIEDATRVCCHFSIKETPIHPDIKISEMNETAKVVYHTTCQQVSIEVEALRKPL
jgi:hypothetical protein